MESLPFVMDAKDEDETVPCSRSAPAVELAAVPFGQLWHTTSPHRSHRVPAAAATVRTRVHECVGARQLNHAVWFYVGISLGVKCAVLQNEYLPLL